MAENTKIEWAHHTFNPWIGCTKVGPGCDNCYAEADFDKRRHVVHWGTNQPRKRTAPSTWAQSLRWNAMAEKQGTRYRVFCASLADVFDNEVPVEWRMDLFELIAVTPHLDWLLLTKRIGNVMPMCSGDSLMFDLICERVWLGATITSQAEADRDIPKLLAVPASKRFLSIEPLLGPVDISALTTGCPNDKEDCCGGPCQIDALYGSISCPACEGPETIYQGLDWVIVGGESGPNARPMHPDWARSLRDQCQAAGVPFLFKQWGEWVPRSDCYHTFEDGTSCADRDPGAVLWPCVRLTAAGHNGRDLAHASTGDDAYMQRIGKKAAGRLLDGRLWDGVPTEGGA